MCVKESVGVCFYLPLSEEERLASGERECVCVCVDFRVKERKKTTLIKGGIKGVYGWVCVWLPESE